MAISLQRENGSQRTRPAPGAGGARRPAGRELARLAVRLVLTAERAVLAQLKPVRVVAPVLARDVVPVLAFLAGQRDLGPDVGRSHGAPFSRAIGGSSRAVPRSGNASRGSVAEAGLEPATQRL